MQDGAVIGFHGGVCWKEIMNSEQTRKKATKKKTVKFIAYQTS